MKQFDITFLGTGNTIPTKLRNHTAIFLELENEGFLVDCGEGTQRQFRQAELSPHKITSLFITHWHGDHILGIPGLLQTLAMSNYQKTLQIFGPKGTTKLMESIKEIMLGIKIKIQIHEISSGTILENKKIKIVAEEMTHGIPALAYSFILKDTLRLDKKKLKKFKLPNSPLLKELQQGKDIKLVGKTIKAKDVTYLEKGKKVTIILDTSFNEHSIKLAKDSNLVIIESSFLSDEEERAKEYHHLTAKQAATIAKKSNSKSLILTHISQRYEHCPEKLLKEAKKVFKNTKLVKDLDSIII